MKIMEYRKQNPDCSYCKHNKTYNIIGHAAECEARQQICWQGRKEALKCPIYEARLYEV